MGQSHPDPRVAARLLWTGFGATYGVGALCSLLALHFLPTKPGVPALTYLLAAPLCLVLANALKLTRSVDAGAGCLLGILAVCTAALAEVGREVLGFFGHSVGWGPGWSLLVGPVLYVLVAAGVNLGAALTR